MTQVRNKVVWLTGASSGFGEALAYALADAGARLILSARRKTELERVKGNCAGGAQANIRILPMDLEQPDTLQLTTEAAIQLFGHIDVLINNAGMRHNKLVIEGTTDTDRRIMETNFFGPSALTRHLLRHFLARKEGHIVNVSSLAGKFGTPYRSGYAASKHALHGFFESLRAEHYRDNIHVTMVCPGFIRFEGEPKSAPRSYSGRSAAWYARKTINAIKKNKEEVILGGRETWGVYLSRWVPGIFSKLIRKVPTR